MARAAVGLVLLLLFSPVAHAERRVALVIGNGAYQKVIKLANSANDAKAIAGMLRAAKFDEVSLYENLGIRELRQAIKDFSDLARGADTAVIYYSGHGIEVNGVNYLIPTDSILDSDIDVPYEAYSLDNLLQVLEPARRLRLVMLDACRENPFARSMKRTTASRAVGGGLAPVEPNSVNTLIGFAAKAGSIALDGLGPNSPYTSALLNNIATPGLDLRIAFGRVRDEVLKATRNKQEPVVYGSLGGTEIALVSATAPQDVRPISPSRRVVDYDKEMEITFWNAVKDARSKELLQTYLERYPSGNFAGLAKALIEQLDKEQSATRGADQEKVAALPKFEVLEPFRIKGFMSWDKNCKSLALPKVHIVVAPKSGKVELRSGVSTVKHMFVGSHPCMGTRQHARLLYYVPLEPPSSEDHLVVKVMFVTGQVKTYDCKIRPQQRSGDCS
jgi:hypothetical protein